MGLRTSVRNAEARRARVLRPLLQNVGMTIYTLDNGVEYETSECPLCELRAPRVRPADGLLHCVSCDMMWREQREAA